MTVELLTTAQAAERMGCSQQWVQALIGQGKLKAQRYGKVYMVRASDADSYERAPLGRPPTKKRVRTRRNGR